MDEKLKKGVRLQIDDTLETLQLRLILNKQTIIQEKNISPDVKAAIDYYQSITKQNQQANSVIRECEVAIEKLFLLKSHIAKLSLQDTLNFFHKYEKYTLEEFGVALKQKTSAIRA